MKSPRHSACGVRVPAARSDMNVHKKCLDTGRSRHAVCHAKDISSQRWDGRSAGSIPARMCVFYWKFQRSWVTRTWRGALGVTSHRLHMLQHRVRGLAHRTHPASQPLSSGDGSLKQAGVEEMSGASQFINVIQYLVANRYVWTSLLPMPVKTLVPVSLCCVIYPHNNILHCWYLPNKVGTSVHNKYNCRQYLFSLTLLSRMS